MKLILALIACSPLVGGLVSPGLSKAEERKEYRITATGTDLGVLQKVKNCVDYKVCTVAGSSIAGDEHEYRYHVFARLLPNELSLVAEECGIDEGGTRFQMVEEETGKPVAESLPPAKNLRLDSPIDLVVMPEEKIEKLNAEVLALLEAGQVIEAAIHASSEVGLPVEDYRFTVSDQPEQLFFVTDHTARTVEIGLGMTHDPCHFIMALRHEAEHIYQIKREAACQGRSGFIDHVVRERSAYLNDIRNVPIFCRDARTATFLRVNAYWQFQDSYIRNTKIEDPKN